MMGVWFAVAFVVFIVVISLISRTPSVKEEKPKRGEWIPKLAQDAATTAKTYDESMKPTAVKVKAKQSARPIIKDDTIRSYTVSYTHLRAHETGRNLVCRLLLEKKNPGELLV